MHTHKELLELKNKKMNTIWKLANVFNEPLFKESTQKSSINLAVREIQIKTPIKYHCSILHNRQ